MRNILYDNVWGLELPRQMQIRRILRVMEEVLTPIQREVLEAYYFQELSVTEIARHRGVCYTTVQRTLRRAEQKLRQHLIY